MVTRTIYPEIPPRVEYALTSMGMGVGPVRVRSAESGILAFFENQLVPTVMGRV